MRYFMLAALLGLLQACSEAPPPALAPSPGPDDPAAPPSNTPYRPVMAGTAYHGLGSTP
jgi:hypothetical protein